MAAGSVTPSFSSTTSSSRSAAAPGTVTTLAACDRPSTYLCSMTRWRSRSSETCWRSGPHSALAVGVAVAEEACPLGALTSAAAAAAAVVVAVVVAVVAVVAAPGFSGRRVASAAVVAGAQSRTSTTRTTAPSSRRGCATPRSLWGASRTSTCQRTDGGTCTMSVPISSSRRASR